MKNELKKKAEMLMKLEQLHDKGVEVEDKMMQLISSLSFEEMMEIDAYLMNKASN